jgi:shikimate dehydrogenase
MQTYGLLGYPVAHSLSPAMHNAAFGHYHIPAQYTLFEKKAEELSAFMGGLSRGDISGLNVTIPYKEKVIPFLQSISEEAALIQAVNTIKITQGRLEGFNTDGQGFLRHLSEDLGYEPRGRQIAMLGAGGAARSLAVYLARAGADSLRIYDVDKQKAESLSAHLVACFSGVTIVACGSMEELKIESCSLLINATPIGMKQSDSVPIDEHLLHKGLFVYDLIYNPHETRLLRLARQKGLQASNGLGMLLYQGMSAFEIWTGLAAPKDVMQQALVEELAKKAVN